MSKPVKHLTWGEESRRHVTAKDVNGLPMHMTFALYVTLCKRLNDNSQLPPDPVPPTCPEGVCKRCWRRFLKDIAQ